jgi:hypothetical protein
VLPLYRFRAAARAAWRGGGTEADVTALRAAIEAAAEADPVISDAEVAGGTWVTVSAIVLAAHPGYAGLRLTELVRDAAGVRWDLAAASVDARPADLGGSAMEDVTRAAPLAWQAGLSWWCPRAGSIADARLADTWCSLRCGDFLCRQGCGNS